MKTHFKDLEDYGIIGNLETCALIGRDGSIDWLCFPHLESASIFAALLDGERGGHFRIKPIKKYESVQAYIENTNILQTTFTTPLGIAVVTDFMKPEGRKDNHYAREVFRKVECIKGEVELEINFSPCFEYAKVSPRFELTESGIIAQTRKENLFLQSSAPLEIQEKLAQGITTLTEGKTEWFVLEYNHCIPLSYRDCERALSDVKRFWHQWVRKSMHSLCVIEEHWHSLVIRSGLVLKLLANPETGAIAAAPTTSLPEKIGGVRNWDYRYAWIRDSSLTAQALFHIGHSKESKDFRRWMRGIVNEVKDPSRIGIMYGLQKEADFEEQILENLSGYKNSSPVRIGNGAAKQKQLDIYGELLNAVYDTTRHGEEIPHKNWKIIERIVDYVCSVWEEKDSGIWEVRGGDRHFVYSKLMCWVALDRAIKVSGLKGFNAPLGRWEKTRDIIKQAILERGYNTALKSFVQSFGSETLDATSLLIPLMDFLPCDDPRVQSTIEATLKRLVTTNGLVYRYEADDGLPGTEGCFVLCSFWLVKALALSGRVEEAEEIFLKVLKYISPLGLLAEEIDPENGTQLGNFPQAFSHIGLINSALYLGIAKGKKYKGPKPIGIS